MGKDSNEKLIEVDFDELDSLGVCELQDEECDYSCYEPDSKKNKLNKLTTLTESTALEMSFSMASPMSKDK